MPTNHKRQVYTCDDLLNFGKYRGRTVAYVLSENPGWVKWAVENVSWFDIDPTTEEIMNAALEQHKDRRTTEGYTKRNGVEFRRGSSSRGSGQDSDSDDVRGRGRPEIGYGADDPPF